MCLYLTASLYLFYKLAFFIVTCFSKYMEVEIIKELPINDGIRARELRVIGDQGEQIGGVEIN